MGNQNGKISYEEFQKIYKKSKQLVESKFVDSSESNSSNFCDECYKQLYKDPDPESMVMWLHSLKYQAKDESWEFETAYPKWATME
ncbi:unnamed protein product [[Candida] boidinii]|nr:unnamed protein product [[Candida] boidinii]